MQKIPLPFFDERKTNINLLMFHCSALNAQEMIEVLENQKLSCHYIIDVQGNIIQTVDEEHRAWHGGLGSWREISEDVNSHSIGIELCHPTLGQTPYSPKQIECLILLSKEIINRYQIKPQYIIGHSDAAPQRKPDPGLAFPWQHLAQQGIGLWYNENTNETTNQSVPELLKQIGYDTSSPEAIIASQYAFARHFMPKLVQIDKDVSHLTKNVYPTNLDWIQHPAFEQILYRTACAYK